jgi:exopolysaccharide biosynthesis predicted pyruvyltransferase EpsI
VQTANYHISFNLTQDMTDLRGQSLNPCILSKYNSLIDDVLGKLIPKGSSIAFFDFPTYSNVGDSAIWLGTFAFIQSHQLKLIYIDDKTLLNRKLPILPTNVIILLQGGGNFGDLWVHHQEFREQLAKKYTKNRIIQLPQSIHFRDKRRAELSRKCLDSHKDFHLLVRDYVSFELATRLYDLPITLCPDMALCLGRLQRISRPQYPVLGLLRSDKEKGIGSDDMISDDRFHSMDWAHERSSIRKSITKRSRAFRRFLSQWISFQRGLKLEHCHALARGHVDRGREILSKGQVVITDRLHGHILCVMMGIPHVVLDNCYGKIGNFRDAWKTGEGLCITASTLRNGFRSAQELLHHPSTLHHHEYYKNC